jgi:O-antigen ligase
VLALVLTASRGGVLTAIVGIAVFYALAPDRLPKLATGLAAAAGSTILIAGLLHRTALRDGLSTPVAVSQRHQLALLLAVTCMGVALVAVGIALAARYMVRPRALKISRPHAIQLTAAGLAVALVVVIAAGVPGQLSHQWRVFKQTDVTGVAHGNVYARLGTVSGSHRYQYWRTALDAYRSKPMTGIGPGTYEFYWAQHGSIYEFVRNAHSLYLETLAEAGLIGFGLIAGLLLTLLGAGVWRTLRAPPLARASLAAATASLAAFCAAAGYDWMWQLAAAPAAALLLAAAILGYREPRPEEAPAGWRAWAPRAGVAALAVAAIIAIAIPFGATSALRSSQGAVRAGDLAAALGDAATAQSLEPYAAAPRLERALALEASGDLRGAREAVAQATARQPTNWRIWLVRARIDAKSGHALAAVRDYRRAHALNPLSPATAQ